MIFIDASHPANRLPLSALESPGVRPLIPAFDAADPYYEAGCHPDVVAWMWERLARKLPEESRCLVYGTPGIVQPVSGVIVAVGMGTQYILRLLPESLPAASAIGCTPHHEWGGNQEPTDLRRSFGEGWVFGSYGRESIEWCRATFHHFSEAPGRDAVRLTPATPARDALSSGRLQLLIEDGLGNRPRIHAVEPDARAVENALRSLDWTRFVVVTLHRDDDHFLEVSGSLQAGDGLSARWVDGDDERIAADAPGFESAISMLQSYVKGDEGLRAAVRWE